MPADDDTGDPGFTMTDREEIVRLKSRVSDLERRVQVLEKKLNGDPVKAMPSSIPPAAHG